MVGIATALAYIKFNKSFALVIFSLFLFEVVMANPLTVILPDVYVDISSFTVIRERFGDHITSGKDFLGYSLAFGGSSILLWIGLIWMFRDVLLKKNNTIISK